VEAATFFRRILAADKQPPLDVVIDTGTVVPALVRFLDRTDAPALQLEAAWSLTNIACGEARHVAYLLRVGALGALLQTVTVSRNAALRDQALWAVCNMTAAVEACIHLLRQQDALLVVLRQIGVQCVMASAFEQQGARDTEQTSGVDSQSGGKLLMCDTSKSSIDPSALPLAPNSHSINGEAVIGDGSGLSLGPEVGTLLSVKQVPVGEMPSLSTMRHVAFICGNVARLKTQLPLSVYRIVLFAMSELAYSPDEEIVLEIASCIAIVITERPQLVGVMLECGLSSRMKDCLEASGTSARLYEMALLVLCALLRSQQYLHRAVVLALGSAPPDGGVFKNGRNSIGVGRHVLQHLVAHMSRETLDTLTKIELCRTLIAVLAFAPKYADMCIELGAVGGLGVFICQDVHDVTEEAGRALCALLLCPGVMQQRSPELINKSAPLLSLLLRAHSVELLHSAMCATQVVLQLACMGHVWLLTADIQEQLDFLVVHPHPTVASVAEGLERVLAKYLASFENRAGP